MKVFDTVQVKKPAKNVFNLSHDVKASYNFDKLYPFLCKPVYPGDTFNCRAEVFLRAMPLVTPVMHNVDMHIYFFFVPMRLVWNADKKHDWKIFITGGEDGMQTAELPYFTYNDALDVLPEAVGNKGIMDYMGFPTVNENVVDTATFNNGNVRVCSLPFRAYQLVYNEYFRNQNVQNEVEFGYGQGHEDSADLQLLLTFRKKCWEKDYFTSCLPWAQRGQAITLPIEGSALVPSGQLNVKITDARVPTTSSVSHTLNVPANGTTVNVSGITASTSSRAVQLEGIASGGTMTFTGLTIGTINDFRYCLRLQQWLEANARCGSRYIEQIFSHFGVKSSDARLQRPELLGGGKIPLIFSDVPQTSYGDGLTGATNVVGDLAGKGTLYGKTSGFKKFFEEHGILLGICTIIPRTSYSQGVPREWTAFDKTDWYFPEFAHLGEQAVLNKEVYYDPINAQSLSTPNDGVFGYQGRFTELRYYNGSFHGDLRNTLQAWHLGRIFSRQPQLNDTFVKASTRANIFALDDVQIGIYDPFVCQMHLDIKAVRPLPKYAIPTL
nr:MAG: major capsid protein [Microviridae sp.]